MKTNIVIALLFLSAFALDRANHYRRIVKLNSAIAPQAYQEVEMNVSAYCVCESCCGEWADGITASGEPAVGKLIAAPPNYAFGTRMDVPGYGTALVQDRGGAIQGNKLDIFFEDKGGVSGHQRALNWGRKFITVKVWR